MSFDNRPLSPHLQIYKPQLTSTLSILHRFTGIALTLGLVLLSTWLYSLFQGEYTYKKCASFLQNAWMLWLLVPISFSLFYHALNGIRHLFWDIGVGLDLRSTYISGWIVVISTIFLTSLFWLFIWVR